MHAHKRFMAVAVMLTGLAISAPAQAQVHLRIPDDIQPPFYANLAHGFLPHTEEWAAVAFYRSPECIPANFNLLDFLDFSGAPFSCPLQIEGRTIWVSLDDPYPASQLMWGTGALPVWFVRWSELEDAAADDVLTIGELAALPSLITGSASFYHESIRNDTRGQRGGNSALVASGTLTDGRSFFVQVTEKFRDGEHLFPHVAIQFR